MSDFRSDPMPSPEGRGRARAAWDAYTRVAKRYVQPAIEKTPIGDAISSVSANAVADLVGFWVVWHLHGGFEGLQNLGMSRSSIYRKIAVFRKVFGQHPDEYRLPGVTLDVGEYLAGGGEDTNKS